MEFLLVLATFIKDYQGLVAGLLAIGAARIAAKPVWEQLKELRKQHAAVLGDLEPDMSLEWKYDLGASRGELHQIVLIVVNRHRLAIRLKCFELLLDSAASLLVQEEKSGETLRHGDGNRGDKPIFTCDYRVPGRDVKDNVVCLELLFEERAPGEPGTESKVGVLVTYELQSNEPQRKTMRVSGYIRRMG